MPVIQPGGLERHFRRTLPRQMARTGAEFVRIESDRATALMRSSTPIKSGQLFRGWKAGTFRRTADGSEATIRNLVTYAQIIWRGRTRDRRGRRTGSLRLRQGFWPVLLRMVESKTPDWLRTAITRTAR